MTPAFGAIARRGCRYVVHVVVPDGLQVPAGGSDGHVQRLSVLLLRQSFGAVLAAAEGCGGLRRAQRRGACARLRRQQLAPPTRRRRRRTRPRRHSSGGQQRHGQRGGLGDEQRCHGSELAVSARGGAGSTRKAPDNRWACHARGHVMRHVGSARGGCLSRRRDCHFANNLFVSILKHLVKVEGGAAE